MRLLAILVNISLLIITIYSVIQYGGSFKTQDLLMIFFMTLTPIVNLVFIFGATDKESLVGLWVETKKKKLRDELDNPASASSDDKDS